MSKNRTRLTVWMLASSCRQMTSPGAMPVVHKCFPNLLGALAKLLCGVALLVLGIWGGGPAVGAQYAETNASYQHPASLTACWVRDPAPGRWTDQDFDDEERRIQEIIEEWENASALSITWSACSGNETEDIRIFLSDRSRNCAQHTTWPKCFGRDTWCQWDFSTQDCALRQIPPLPPPLTALAWDSCTALPQRNPVDGDLCNGSRLCFWSYIHGTPGGQGQCESRHTRDAFEDNESVPECKNKDIKYGNAAQSWGAPPGSTIPETGDRHGCQFTARFRGNANKNLYLHEFGHLIGLGEEFKRYDNTCGKTPDPNSPSTAWVTGIWATDFDVESVMNYSHGHCATLPHGSDGDSGLSDKDKLAVEMLYPFSQVPTFVTAAVYRDDMEVLLVSDWEVRGATVRARGWLHNFLWQVDGIDASTCSTAVLGPLAAGTYHIDLAFDDFAGRPYTTAPHATTTITVDNQLHTALIIAAM